MHVCAHYFSSTFPPLRPLLCSQQTQSPVRSFISFGAIRCDCVEIILANDILGPDFTSSPMTPMNLSTDWYNLILIPDGQSSNICILLPTTGTRSAVHQFVLGGSPFHGLQSWSSSDRDISNFDRNCSTLELEVQLLNHTVGTCVKCTRYFQNSNTQLQMAWKAVEKWYF